MQGDIAFLKLRNEFRAHARGSHPGHDDQGHGPRHHQPAQFQRHAQNRGIELRGTAHQDVRLFLHLARNDHRNRSRDEGQGEDHRRREGENHGEGHRVEHFPFHACQGEDRDIDQGDDQHAEERGTDHLGRSLGGLLEALLTGQQAAIFMLPQTEPPQAVLDNDHRPVDNQTEV